ncbi:unnamed protein product [Arctia plantaginis]|uniref:Bcl-2 Bcl-2 homology region 1-3 domain-containing protein n=1 Tax=Arctia plantaginis TaxID=874455 RepID=A0A8S1AUA0_ARCPL|nr:unnamed protein product [Arctia plantaginis]
MLIEQLTDRRWKQNHLGRFDSANIAIQVTPPDGEEDDDFIPALRLRRKLSTPLSALPGGLLSIQNHRAPPSRSMSTFDRTKRRFSTMVSSTAASALSRRLSATIGWCLTGQTQVKPHIQIVLKRLQRMVETECGEEAATNTEAGVLAALRSLCAALERKKPNAFRQVARQATRAPSAMLKSDTALAELSLALGRRITRDNITWCKIAAVYCVCGALAKEAAEAAEGEPALELVTAPAAAIADLLHEEAGSWITSHGGWNGLVHRLRTSERDPRSEKNLQLVIGLFVCACISLMMFRWVLQAHPAYMDNNE